MKLSSARLTVKEQIDEALREVTSRPRHELIVVVSPRGYEHIRSYCLSMTYRGASVRVDTEQLEAWIVRPLTS